ncbi:MAG: DUF1801 domain-containing protein [Sinimarinibacterium flocculans]|uniref:DUF1801 domain-containing protein n=1 Tax=Sinimarinibacterium flocculans TaxID=985250 RepID=UPI003C387613
MSQATSGEARAAALIDARIAGLGDWRGETLAKVRRLIHDADPEIVEEVKWAKPSNPKGVPVWSHGGIVCTGETYKQVVKLTFAKGAALPDPAGLFNASLDGNVRRAIDIREGETLNAKAFKTLIKAAVVANLQSAASKSKPKAAAVKKVPAKLLSGGNPQIAKADGDAPVQAYIAAMPGWKSDLGRQLDALIVRTVPDVRKAAKWNSPLYGMENRGWFLSVHVFTHFVKVTFFKGTSLRPPPPGGTPRSGEARWIDIREGAFDAAQMTRWVKQAAKLPGWVP